MERLLDTLIDAENCKVNWDLVWNIPEFNILQTTHQNPKWHMEDLVSLHTKMVTENICEFMKEEPDHNKRLYMIAAALFHDIGKGITTEWSDKKENWESPRHAIAGEQLTRKMLWEESFDIREKICSLVRNHMKPLYIHEKKNHVKEIAKLSEDCDFEELLLLKKADCLGAKSTEDDGWQEKLDKVYNDAKDACCINGFKFKNEHMRYTYFNGNDDYINPMDDDYGKFTVYIMIGLPGAGKDTYIKNHLNDLPVVCRDNIRKEIGLTGEKPMGNKDEENKVTQIHDKMIETYAKMHQSFVINNTNLKLKYREGYKNIVSKYKPKIVYVYVEAPTFKDNLKRREGTIPPYVIERMRDNFEFPRRFEAYEIIIDKQ